MAHNVRSGTTVTQGPRTLLERPALAALLGAVAAEWAFLEQSVMGFYAYLMGRYLPRLPGWSAPVHPVALQVFDTLETQRLRLDLLRKLTKWIVRDASLVVELDDQVLPAIRKAGVLRNTLLHSSWGISPAYPEAIIRMPVFGHQLVYQATDLNEAIDRIIAARRMLMGLETKVRAAHSSAGALPIDEPVSDEEGGPLLSE